MPGVRCSKSGRAEELRHQARRFLGQESLRYFVARMAHWLALLDSLSRIEGSSFRSGRCRGTGYSVCLSWLESGCLRRCRVAAGSRSRSRMALRVECFELRERFGIIWAFAGARADAESIPLPDLAPYGMAGSVDISGEKRRSRSLELWCSTMGSISFHRASCIRTFPSFFRIQSLEAFRQRWNALRRALQSDHVEEPRLRRAQAGRSAHSGQRQSCYAESEQDFPSSIPLPPLAVRTDCN